MAYPGFSEDSFGSRAYCTVHISVDQTLVVVFKAYQAYIA